LFLTIEVDLNPSLQNTRASKMHLSKEYLNRIVILLFKMKNSCLDQKLYVFDLTHKETSSSEKLQTHKILVNFLFWWRVTLLFLQPVISQF